jgi:hypothetical protein
MVEFASKNDENELKSMWKTVFEDTDFYINLYFKYNFQPDNTLIFRINSQIVSMLFMRSYEFRFWGEIIQCYYLSGLATLPAFRKQHIMNQLIGVSNQVMTERDIPLAILIPKNFNMFAFYAKLGYKKVFAKNYEKIPLKNLIDRHNSLLESYIEFNKIYREKDFCIQKDFTDFQAIIEEWEYEQRPPKTNLAAMAQIIAPLFLFNIYKQKTGNNVKLNLVKSNKIFLKNGVLTTSTKTLCSLLFGYQSSRTAPEIHRLFPRHKPILNLMLE